jgi:hypothetical protein
MYGLSTNFRNFWGLGESPPQFIALLIGLIALAGVTWLQRKNPMIRLIGLVILTCGTVFLVFRIPGR